MIHSRIREIRKEQGLTLQDVADRAGTTAQTIGRLETGTRTLSLNWVNRISRALGVDAGLLLALPEKGDIEIFGEIGKTGHIFKKPGGTVSTRLFAANPTALKIKENIGPYMTGDILIFEQKPTNPKNFHAKECLVHLSDGTFCFALVFAGKASKTFSVALIGQKNKVLENQKIEGTYPLVALVRKFE